MTLLPIITFSLILSLVPFSVALSSSVYRCIDWKESFRIAIVFTLFQTVMLAVGWSIGFGIKGLLHDMAVPVATVIMFFIGTRMFLDSRRLGRESRTMAVKNNRILLGFALVISINTALLSMGLGLLYADILSLAGFVFLIVFFMTLLGIQAGKRGMMNLGRTAETISGIGLIIISIIIILQYFKIF